jgi:predicted GH43/DUF377 family glycosyl hydrolase
VKIKSKLLLSRYDFKPSIHGWDVKGSLNPAAIRLPNRKIMLMVRVAEASDGHGKLKKCPVISSEEDYKTHFKEINKGQFFKMGGNVVHIEKGVCKLSTISHFRKIILNEDGFKVEKILQTPEFTGIKSKSSYGVEDPRIVKIGKQYIMTYVSIGDKEGVCTSLAISKDLEKWERKGIIFREQNKDAFLFPEKIKGKYVALHRPEGFFEFSKPNIWISHSPDMIYWGEEKVIMQPRKDSWDEIRIGGGTPPIKTKKGWLIIYHGMRNVRKKGIYSAGAALLDLKNPEKIIARSPKKRPLLKPTEKYEKEGFINNVVFPTGAVPTLDGKSLLIYSGGADKVVSVKKISFKDIFKNMEKV